jgi:hypothetical protein
MSGIDRRAVLHSAPAALMLPAVWRPGLSQSERKQWRDLALRTLSHKVSSQAIGEAYCAQSSPEVSARLLARVTSRLSSLSGLANETEAVQAAIRSDYAGARIAKIDGWVLSETEIALAVLSLEGRT